MHRIINKDQGKKVPGFNKDIKTNYSTRTTSVASQCDVMMTGQMATTITVTMVTKI